MPTKPFVLFLLICTSTLLVNCTGVGRHSEQGFRYTNIERDTTSALSGEGSAIQFKGNSLPLSGKSIQIGGTRQSVKIAQGDLSLIDDTDTSGSIRLINVVPLLETAVCEQQTQYLREKNQGLDQQVKLITISVDTPFAHDCFVKGADITNVNFLSDFRGGEFGKTHEHLLDGPHVLARAVLVVDGNNIVRHLQVAPNLAHLPYMEKAFQVTRSLTNKKG